MPPFFCAAPFKKRKDPRLWSKDLERHSRGEFSFAMVQTSEDLEEYGEVHTSTQATFVGLYDGHGGIQASRFVSEHLYRRLLTLARTAHRIDENIIRQAFQRTEERFIDIVRRNFHPLDEEAAGHGSCCLVGIIHGSRVLIANLGNSRAVLGRVEDEDAIVAEPLTVDHSVKEPDIRQQLQLQHLDDPHLFQEVDNVFRIRGRIQVTKAIGDAYLKFPELAVSNETSIFHLEHPITRPILNAEPEIRHRAMQVHDTFIIFATAGFWAFMTNEDAVGIVDTKPRMGIAKRLIKTALKRAAKNANISYSALKAMEVEGGERREIHDDMSVVVLFTDLQVDVLNLPVLSVRGFHSDGAAIPFGFQ